LCRFCCTEPWRFAAEVLSGQPQQLPLAAAQLLQAAVQLFTAAQAALGGLPIQWLWLWLRLRGPRGPRGLGGLATAAATSCQQR